MARFDSTDHLERYAATGRFPAIHDDIAAMVRMVLDKGTRVCDLGASTGLLARRLHAAGYRAVGVESSAKAIQLGDRYGTWGPEVPVTRLHVTPDNLDVLAGVLEGYGITAVVARRVLPELHDAGVTPKALGDTLEQAGVRHLILEGRAPRKGATHQLPSLEAELDALGWRVEDRAGHVAHAVSA